MSAIFRGIVKQGVIVPGDTLPEGTCVEIRICDPAAAFTPVEQAELDAWQQAGAGTLQMVEDVPPELQTELEAWRQARARAWEITEQEIGDH